MRTRGPSSEGLKRAKKPGKTASATVLGKDEAVRHLGPRARPGSGKETAHEAAGLQEVAFPGTWARSARMEMKSDSILLVLLVPKQEFGNQMS